MNRSVQSKSPGSSGSTAGLLGSQAVQSTIRFEASTGPETWPVEGSTGRTGRSGPVFKTLVISKDSNLSGFRLERNIVNLELIYFIRFLFILFNAKIIAEIILLIYYRIHCDYEILNYIKF